MPRTGKEKGTGRYKLRLLLTTLVLCAILTIVFLALREKGSPYWYLPLVGWGVVIGGALWLAPKSPEKVNPYTIEFLIVDPDTTDEAKLQAPESFAHLSFIAEAKGWRWMPQGRPITEGTESVWAREGDPQTWVRVGAYPLESRFVEKWFDYQESEAESFYDRLGPDARTQRRTLNVGEHPCFEIKGGNAPGTAVPKSLRSLWINVNGTHVVRVDAECGHAKWEQVVEAAYNTIVFSMDVQMGRV